MQDGGATCRRPHPRAQPITTQQTSLAALIQHHPTIAMSSWTKLMQRLERKANHDASVTDSEPSTRRTENGAGSGHSGDVPDRINHSRVNESVLCTLCRTLPIAAFLDPQDIGRSPFVYHDSWSSLQDSALRGCPLCMFFWKQSGVPQDRNVSKTSLAFTPWRSWSDETEKRIWLFNDKSSDAEEKARTQGEAWFDVGRHSRR